MEGKTKVPEHVSSVRNVVTGERQRLQATNERRKAFWLRCIRDLQRIQIDITKQS